MKQYKAIVGAIAAAVLFGAAQPVWAACSVGDQISRSMEAEVQRQVGILEAERDTEAQLRANAMKCQEQVIAIMKKQIRSFDILDGIKQRVIDALMNKACSIVLDKAGQVVRPIDVLNGEIGNIEGVINGQVSDITGGIVPGVVGSRPGVGVPGLGTPGIAPPPAPGGVAGDIYNRISCRFTGTCPPTQ